VVVEECEPAAGVKPLRWLLWTTLPVANWDEALVVVQIYEKRWLIERYHYVLKSGCGIEQVQLETAERLERALAVCCIVAWRLLWLTYQARATPDVQRGSVFARHQWQALVCTTQRTAVPPSEPPTLREAVRMVAQLGGFLGRKGEGSRGQGAVARADPAGRHRCDLGVGTWIE
jgi:hypothetical protein